MSRVFGLILVVLIVVVLLVWSGFLNLSPEGEQALDETREGIGAAVEETGNAIQDAGENVSNPD